ncbi:MAG: hypothetical protein WBE92_15025 [Steroidobacteraceae bacterium]
MMLSRSSQLRFNYTVVATSLCLAALALGGQAHATCLGSGTPNQVAPAGHAGMRLTPAIYHPGDAATGTLVRVNELEYPPIPAPVSIVGLWQFQFTGDLPDYGTQVWHSDGTELIFSGGQNPATGDVCQGVWKQIGPRTYTLNHVAFGWAGLDLQPVNPTEGQAFARIHFHFLITLDPSGDKFTGKFTADFYSELATDPFNEDPSTNPPMATLTGNVTATRIQPDEGP